MSAGEREHARARKRANKRGNGTEREKESERERERERGGYSEKTIERGESAQTRGGESAQTRPHAKKKRDRSALRNTEIMADTLRVITVWARESAHTNLQHKTERRYRAAEHSLFGRSWLQHYVPEVGGQTDFV